MKRSLVTKGLLAILMICILVFAVVSCGDNEGDPLDPNDGVTADKAALNAELALEVVAQGDYTDDSYHAYVEALTQAKKVANDAAATQVSVNSAVANLTAARLALEIRPVELVEGANREIHISSGENKELAVADYLNENGLSKISYKVLVSNEVVTASAVSNGKFTITAGVVAEETIVKVSINAYYNNQAKRTVELTIVISEKPTATLVSDEVVNEIDLSTVAGKESLTLDFAKNVKNIHNLPLTFAATLGDEPITLDGALYTYVLGEYTEVVTCETFTVTITWTAGGEEHSLTYTYKLVLKNSGKFALENGGFENDLDGWTVVGNIGNVSSDTHYWLNDPENADGYAFGMDGDKMFSAYAPGAQESAVGTLTSSTFTIGGSGFVTFKVGAMRDGNYVYIDVVDAETKEILARYYNRWWAERTNGVKSGCTLVAYKADLSAHMGKEVFFRVSDNADSGYGLFFVDSFVTHYAFEPDGFNVATPVPYEVSGTIYDVFNGGFEMGDVQGWWNDGTPGLVTGADAFFSGVSYGKDGNFLYSGVQDLGGAFLEDRKGVLTSSAFEIGGTGYISFMLGGGGNELCYVQVIDAVTGEVLAKYHQQAMEDAVLKTYVADLSAYIGRTARVQVVDQAESGWGCVSFDNVVTYYPAGVALPEGALTAVDIKNGPVIEPANKEALDAELALKVTAQGDYTEDTYNAYVAALQEAKLVLEDEEASQERVDEVTTNLTNARLALAIRPVEEVAGANKVLQLMANEQKEIVLSDYVNVNGLSKITYSILASDELVTVGTLADGKFTITAGEVGGEATMTVTITVSYDGEEKCEVVLTVNLSEEPMATLKQNAIANEFDLINLENKENMVLDFAQNVNNSHNLALTYTAKLGEEPITLTGSQYTFTFGDYSEVPTNVTFTVTITWNTNGNDRNF